MKKILISASIALIAFSSCKKEAASPDTPTTSNHNTISAHQKVFPDDAANPANPYDDAGYWHNVALQDTRSTWTQANVGQSDVYAAIGTYITTTSAPYTLQSSSTLLPAYNNAISDASNKYANYIASTSLSALAKTYENNLVGVAYNNQITSFAAFKAACISIENTIIGDTHLSASERQTLLESASVIRHSALYWENEDYDHNPPGSNPVAMRRSIFGWIWRAAYTMAADGVGCATAGPAGAVVFSAIAGTILLTP